MRKILLATTLLSIAISEDILVEKNSRLTTWIREKQFPSKRLKRASRDDILSELEDVPNYDNADRQFLRISDPQFIKEPMQPPPVIRRSDLMRISQNDPLPFDKSKLDDIKPKILISIGVQDNSAAGSSQEEYSTRKNYRKHIQDWQMQQPFYVEEPYWIDINTDYTEGSAQHPEGGDPYIMSRGKKFRIKSPDKEKTMKDYEELLDYTSKNKRLSTKNRVRRSVGTTAEGLQGDSVADKRRNREEETRRYNLLRDFDGVHISKVASIQARSPDEESSKTDESGDENAEKRKNIPVNPAHDIFVEELEMDKSRNSMKESPYDRKFVKGNQVTANDTLITSSVEEERKIERKEIPSYMESDNDETIKVGKRSHSHKNHFVIGTNNENERYGIFVKRHGKGRNRKIDWINADYDHRRTDNIDRKKTTMLERMRLRDGHLDRIENFSTYGDFFIPSRGKKPLSESDDLDRKDTKPSKSSAGRWEDLSSIQRYAQREESESDKREVDEAMEDESGTDQNETRSTDARLMTKPDSKSFSGIRTHANYREKRNTYDTRSDLWKDALLRNIEREIVESTYLRPRDKHSNVLDLQNHLSTDPFFIMRGKKASHELPDAVSSVTERRNDMDDVARAIHYSIEENLLKMLLMERSKCNEQYCDIDVSRPLRDKPVFRNRRNPLDNLLKYDPYVIIRGKRAKLDNF
ncbi:uncharacterized protein LOC116850021 [Odontomachus brunneus]|uniref:uncharacterized protein LOC116850021 n=1 Tax=Odontomachus brunneus TaxID=486640 RepID=UPI0013F1AD28|nr:uncharacterized protein LOC116850021 [Odontomachus brunneus]